MEQTITLTLAGILAFVVVMYVLLDGFDLGVGILFPFVPSEHERDLMMSSITPVWDGNETWLVLGAATLYGAFPVIYSTLLPTLYLPLFLMLIALVFRGVSFEFRHLAHGHQWVWNTFFSAGSAIAAFCQGMVLGTFVQGYSGADGVFIATDYQWLTPFSVLTGLAVVAGYALLGATWLIRKTEGDLQSIMHNHAKKILILVTLFSLIATIWTPFVDPDIKARWFSLPYMLYLAPLPIIGLISILFMWHRLNNKTHDALPFILTMIIFLVSYAGFIFSIWPYAIPHAMTVWQAAAPLNVQVFILVGLLIVIPIILAYTAYSYWVFKGKILHNDGAHY